MEFHHPQHGYVTAYGIRNVHFNFMQKKKKNGFGF
jgi:hypothetical protein